MNRHKQLLLHIFDGLSVSEFEVVVVAGSTTKLLLVIKFLYLQWSIVDVY